MGDFQSILLNKIKKTKVQKQEYKKICVWSCMQKETEG